MSAELVIGNSLAALELLDSTPEFRIDGLVVLGKPAILLLLCFKQMLEDFLDAAGTG